MAVQFKLPTTDVKTFAKSGHEGSFNKELSEASKHVLQNIWDFTAGAARECYAYVDFDRHNIDSFVVVDNYIANPLELHTLEGADFPDDPQRREAFIQYFANDVHNFEQVFTKYKKMLPRRAWMGIEVESNKRNLSLDYSPTSTVTPDIAESIDRFRFDVASSSWPLPIWTIARIETP